MANRSFVVLLAALMLAQPTHARKKNDKEEVVVAPQVQRLQPASNLDSSALIYALPQTVFRIVVKVEHTIFEHGIYALYAAKYIGITGLQPKSSEVYRIADVQLSTYIEADPQQLYVVHPNGAKFDFISLTKEGLMVLPETFFFTADASATATSGDGSTSQALFTDVVADGIFREVKAAQDDGEEDSANVPRDPLRLTLQAKTPEERAVEAAQHIFNLRNRRVELITGEVDHVFAGNGEALKIALAETRRIEREYLSLFIGKTRSRYAYYSFDITPTAGATSYPVCRFLPESGIVSTSSAAEANVFFSLKPETGTLAAIASTLPLDEGSFRLRLPATCGVQVRQNNEVIQRGRFRVFQLGDFFNLNLLQQKQP